jgi:hypothetical protein
MSLTHHRICNIVLKLHTFFFIFPVHTSVYMAITNCWFLLCWNCCPDLILFLVWFHVCAGVSVGNGQLFKCCLCITIVFLFLISLFNANKQARKEETVVNISSECYYRRYFLNDALSLALLIVYTFLYMHFSSFLRYCFKFLSLFRLYFIYCVYLLSSLFRCILLYFIQTVYFV